MSADRTERPDSLHSWLVAIVGAVAMVFTFGTPLSYGIFRDPLSDAFDIAPVTLSMVFALMLFTFFIGSGLVGMFGARFRSRVILLACTGATVAVAPSLYVVDSIFGLSLAFATLGLAMGTMFVLVASIVPRWFEERRGAATGLIFVGNGLGLFVLPPVWQYAFAEYGVRQGFLLIVGATGTAFLLAGLVCRRPVWAERTTATVSEVIAWVSGLLGTRSFQLLFLGVALSFGWYQLLAAYAVDLFASRGLSGTAASTAFGLIGGVSIVSRIGGGYVADLAGARRAFLTSLSCTAIGLSLLFLDGLPALGAAILLMGLGLGGAATLYIPLLMGIYSPKRDTAIVGVFNVAAGIAALVIPPLGTAIVAYTGGFSLAILLTVLLTVVAVTATAAATQ